MRSLLPFLVFIGFLGCRESRTVTQDEIYSHFLQRKVKLTIIHTRIPNDRSQLHLLFLNDGQQMEVLRVKEITDSLSTAGLLPSLVIVGIHAGDRMQEFGIAGKPDFAGRGKKAASYQKFIDRELYHYVQKKTGTSRFSSVGIAGFSLGGLSAFDIAWDLSNKFDKVGIFSGSFWWRDLDQEDSGYSDTRNRIALTKIKSSRKTPFLRFWFYAGEKEESSDRDNDGMIDVVDDTQDLIDVLEKYRHIPAENIFFLKDPNGIHDWPDWEKQLPKFLTWAYSENR